MFKTVKHHLFRRTQLIPALFLVLWLILPAGDGAAQDPAPDREAVMPFIKGRDPRNLNQPLNCPFSRFCYENTGLEAGADETMTRMLYGMIEKKRPGRLVPLEDVLRVYDGLSLEAEDTPLEAARLLGRKLNARHVLVGNVWRFRERVGTSFSVQTPASVAFSIYLVDVETGMAVWEAGFDETQKPLSENLLDAPDFFRRGAKWLTAEELARSGMEKILKKYPESVPEVFKSD